MSKSKLILITALSSLALNLFFVGGILYRVANFKEFGPRPIPPNVSWIVRDLSEARQAELAPLMKQNRSDANIIRRQMFESQRRVNELIASPNYHTPTLAEAFTELRSIGLQYQELSHQQMLTILSQLTAGERTIAQEFMQRRGPQNGQQGRRTRPPRPGSEGNQRRPPPPQN